jgi:alkylated DNA repair protein alkB homolog 1
MGRKKQDSISPDSPLYQNTTQFRILERTAKRKGPIDHIFLPLDTCPFVEVELFDRTKKCYTIPDFPGFYIVKEAITVGTQRRLIRQALEQWTRPPNVSNLDSHWHLNPDGIWNQLVNWKHSNDPEEPIIKKRFFEQQVEMYSESTNLEPDTSQPSCKSGSEEKNAFIIDSDTKLLIDKPTDPMSTNKDAKLTKLLPRLRWATLGKQYNWTKKEYHYDLERNPAFPPLMVELCDTIVSAFEPIIRYDPNKWKPEAGIINFYQPGDSLMAHQDKSEPNSDAPLLSISLGLDCAFLIGTDDRQDKPVALRLSSGDLVIMYGPARRSFHGVPRVLENTCPGYLQTNEPEWKDIKDYIAHTRMNINVRQVF